MLTKVVPTKTGDPRKPTELVFPRFENDRKALTLRVLSKGFVS